MKKLLLPLSILIGCSIIGATSLYIHKDNRRDDISKYIFEMNIKCEEYGLKKYEKLSEISEGYILTRKIFYSHKLNSCVLREDVSSKEFSTKMLLDLNTQETIAKYNSQCIPDSQCDNLGEFFNTENSLRAQ